MSEEKPARITAFTREQGFGRVAVPGEGEVVFDRSVAQCSTDDGLVVGAEVLVCTGPGRVAGQRKVTRLRLPDTTLPEAPPAEVAERFETFGPYRYLLPPFWPEGSVNAREPIWTAAARLNDVQCTLMVYVGGATDAKAKADLIAARSAQGPTTRRDEQVVGLPFEGYRFDRGAEVELLYVLTAHGDLLLAGSVVAPENEPAAEQLSPLLLTMVGAAVHRRGPEASQPGKKPGGFWKRLFG